MGESDLRGGVGVTQDANRMLCEQDWTAADGRANSSPEFLRLCDEIEQIIRGDAYSLIAGRSDRTARLIMARLAHVHGLRPSNGASDGD